MTHFADDLIRATRDYGPLCVGLDPYADKLPQRVFGPPSPESFHRFFSEIIDLCAHRVAVVKPQIALFEAMGPEGLQVLQALVRQAKAAGLLVLLDAKRGDIGATAQGYADAYLGPDAWLPVDALTLNPSMGADTLAPFLKYCASHGKGVSVRVRTSNPGGGDLQDRDCGGKPLFLRTAKMLHKHADALRGETGWSSLTVVVGATVPAEAKQVRKALPKSPFLVPGYGAQGASAREAMAGFVQTEHGLEGGIVSASRSVLYPTSASISETLTEWRDAVERGLMLARDELLMVAQRG